MLKIDPALNRGGIAATTAGKQAAEARFTTLLPAEKASAEAALAGLIQDRPEVVLMDEPTRSLDPASCLSLRAFIRDELKTRDGKTILLATHNLREAEALCDLNHALLNLPKGSPMHRRPERFGITAVVPFHETTDLSLYDDFRCGVAHPRVGVLGLNPHAGEDGLLGREEIEVIAPALDKLRARMGAAGLPMEAAFTLVSNCVRPIT